MQIRDRIKQTGTATSSTAITMSGAAAAKRLTFEQGFQMPTVAQAAGTITWRDVPVEVERADGSWGVHIATVTRDGSNVVTVTLDELVTSSVFNATTRAFDSYGLAASDAVTVAVTPSAASLGGVVVQPRGRYPNWQNAGAEGINTLADGPFRSNNALLAIGDVAMAGTWGNDCPGAVAIGDGASVGLNMVASYSYALGRNAQIGGLAGGPIKGAYGLGYGASSSKTLSAVLGGCNAYPDMHQQIATGHGIGILAASSQELYQFKRAGEMAYQTSDATPARLRCYDETGAAISGSEDGFFIDVGAMVIAGTLVAFEPATGDRKVWRLEWVTTSNAAYTDTLALGTPTVTVLYETNPGGSTSTWDADPFFDDTLSTSGVEVTGQAAKTITWSFIYDSHYHEVW